MKINSISDFHNIMNTKSKTNDGTRYTHTKEHPFIVSILLIVLGVLWCVWLYKLHIAPETRTMKCRQVEPILRNTLLIFAVFMACLSIYFIVQWIIHPHDEWSTNMWIRKCMPMMLLLIIFLIQILYILHIQKRNSIVEQDCSQKQYMYKYTVGGFAIIQILVGLYIWYI